MVSKKGVNNFEPKKNIENPTAAPRVTNNIEVEMGFTKNFLGSKSKETKTSNSFNALVTDGPASNFEEQHKEGEEEEELDDSMPPNKERYATPKLTTTSHLRRKTREKLKILKVASGDLVLHPNSTFC